MVQSSHPLPGHSWYSPDSALLRAAVVCSLSTSPPPPPRFSRGGGARRACAVSRPALSWAVFTADRARRDGPRRRAREGERAAPGWLSPTRRSGTARRARRPCPLRCGRSRLHLTSPGCCSPPPPLPFTSAPAGAAPPPQAAAHPPPVLRLSPALRLSSGGGAPASSGSAPRWEHGPSRGLSFVPTPLPRQGGLGSHTAALGLWARLEAEVLCGDRRHPGVIKAAGGEGGIYQHLAFLDLPASHHRHFARQQPENAGSD